MCARSGGREDSAERRGSGTPLVRAGVEAADWALEKGRRIATDIDRAKAIIRSEGFFEAELSLSAFSTLADGFRLACAPYIPSALHLTEYDSACLPDSGQVILAAVRDRDFNLFRALLERAILPHIRRERPDPVAISLTSAHQVIAGFTLALPDQRGGHPSSHHAGRKDDHLLAESAPPPGEALGSV